ncbi:hypothetical protein MUG91_G145n63 [Manis pentadactyla]|nr:hypothetical protein MUG91_G145n63 [Manis pentadactyla]
MLPAQGCANRLMYFGECNVLLKLRHLPKQGWLVLLAAFVPHRGRASLGAPFQTAALSPWVPAPQNPPPSSHLFPLCPHQTEMEKLRPKEVFKLLVNRAANSRGIPAHGRTSGAPELFLESEGHSQRDYLLLGHRRKESQSALESYLSPTGSLSPVTLGSSLSRPLLEPQLNQKPLVPKAPGDTTCKVVPMDSKQQKST